MLFKERTLERKIKLARERARRWYIKIHGGFKLPPWIEIHHVDFCPLNNSPVNWKALNKRAHIDLHSNDVDSAKSNKALDDYLSRELEAGLRELTLLCNIHNTEYGEYETAYIDK
jgi:hypothetical protein